MTALLHNKWFWIIGFVMFWAVILPIILSILVQL